MFFNVSFSQYKKSPSPISNCETLLVNANNHLRESNLAKAIENFIAVKECVGNKQYSSLYVQACIGLGNVYNNIYDTTEAVNQFKEGINHQIIFEKNEQKPQMYMRYGIGKALFNNGSNDAAIGLIKLSTAIAKMHSDTMFEIEANNDLAFLLAIQNNKDANEVFDYLSMKKKEISLPSRLASEIEITKIAIDVSNNSNTDLSNYNFTNQTLSARERFLRLKHTVENKKSISQNKLTSYVVWDNLKDSVQIDFYKTFKDSLQIRYQKRTNDAELYRLNIQGKLNESELGYKNKNILTLGLLIGFLILATLMALYFLEKIKKQKALVENLQKELHHRVKNNLSIIDSFIEVTKDEFDDQKFDTKLTELQNRINSINEVHQQLYTNNDITNLNLKNYIEKLTKNVSAAFSNQNIIIEKNVKDNLRLQTDKSFPIGLIINEFLTNSYKYAFNNNQGKIKIYLNDIGNTYQLSLSDNGKGLPSNFDIDKTDSFGLRIIKLLAQQLNGTFDLTSTEGVQLTINFPKS